MLDDPIHNGANVYNDIYKAIWCISQSISDREKVENINFREVYVNDTFEGWIH